MPAPGDQHKSNGAAAHNPFEEVKPHVSEYTAQEIATLQYLLNKRLGPEFISTRPGPGNQKIAYLSAEKAINLANEVFGFNGWSSSIQHVQVDFVDENAQTGKVSLGLSVVVRVTLRDGTYHEDVGYGGIENCKGKAMAFEKSKKEATTDALKRTLRNFGNVLGNCIYDKDFVTRVSKVKAGTTKFDVNDLHRLPEFTTKPEPVSNLQQPAAPTGNPEATTVEAEDSFDAMEFDDVDIDDSSFNFGRPDETVVSNDTTSHNVHHVHKAATAITTPSRLPQVRGGEVLPALPKPETRISAAIPAIRQSESQHQFPVAKDNTAANGMAQMRPPSQESAVRPAGFYSARVAANIDQNNISNMPVESAKFNPHAESPSIKRSVGVDHTKSVPIKRDAVDFRGEHDRKIGLPGFGAAMSGVKAGPGVTTSNFRPPTRLSSPVPALQSKPNITEQGANDRGLTAAKRPPLGDVSNLQQASNAPASERLDAKRQRFSDSGGALLPL